MYDPNGPRREQRRYYRAQRRYGNSLRGVGTALFLVALVIGFSLDHNFDGAFLIMLFVGLAFLSLFSSASSLHRHGIYGGLHGFVWCLGLALCFWIGFWPWILLPVAATLLLGSLFNPIMMGLSNSSFLTASPMQQQPYQQPAPPQEQPSYQPYQEGYQSAPPPPTYQKPAPKQEYEQPQVQYPDQPQELPPMQQ
jgi:hypothetical protein